MSSNSKNQHVSVLMPDWMIEKLDELGKPMLLKRGAMVRHIILSYINGESVPQNTQKMLSPVNKLAAIEIEPSKPVLTRKAEKAIEKLRNRIEKQKVLEANAPDEQVYERVRQRIEALYEMVERIEAGENPDIVVPELAAPVEPEPLTEADLQPVEDKPVVLRTNAPPPANVMNMDWE